jgi:hypothetical protein
VSLEGQCDQFTEEWTLVRVAITGEKIRGEWARLTFTFHCKAVRASRERKR